MQSLQQQIFSVRSSSATTSCEEYSNQTKASSAEGKMPMLQKVGKVCCVIFVISRWFLMCDWTLPHPLLTPCPCIHQCVICKEAHCNIVLVPCMWSFSNVVRYDWLLSNYIMCIFTMNIFNFVARPVAHCTHINVAQCTHMEYVPSVYRVFWKCKPYTSQRMRMSSITANGNLFLDTSDKITILIYWYPSVGYSAHLRIRGVIIMHRFNSGLL